MPLDYYLCGIGEHGRAKQANGVDLAGECEMAVRS